MNGRCRIIVELRGELWVSQCVRVERVEGVERSLECVCGGVHERSESGLTFSEHFGGDVKSMKRRESNGRGRASEAALPTCEFILASSADDRGGALVLTRAYSLSLSFSNDHPRPNRVWHCDLIIIIITRPFLYSTLSPINVMEGDFPRSCKTTLRHNSTRCIHRSPAFADITMTSFAPRGQLLGVFVQYVRH